MEPLQAVSDLSSAALLILPPPPPSSPRPQPGIAASTHKVALTHLSQTHEAPSYPGLPGTFVHKSGDWSLLPPNGTYICRGMTFISQDPQSYIHDFYLFARCNGHVYLSVKFRELAAKFVPYAQTRGLTIPCLLGSSYVTRSSTETKLLFSILKDNNTISEEDQRTIQEIIDKSGSYTPPEEWTIANEADLASDSPSG